ncbi:cytidine deaminase [Parasphaerochaeta coccoides]|uniref:Cytidine deaminase n=1 Tax=Parasphaerochaeta coccoides (strain ATCC BAA-1237 / DSM 17374 / SPN1) TaxID=760011 RepID=F4GKA6_PARC1|nr:cytidine deaminase [Parasphaerochaeta coccoides]AEC02302.1 cytidine deaminase [Parasphaerochaeta coccoides DSM 17374]
MLTAVLFDMDGVLIDSEPLIQDAMISWFADQGVTVYPRDFKAFFGVGETAMLRGVGGCHDYVIDDIDTAKLDVYERYYRLLEGKDLSHPGILRFFKNARKAGLITAIVSSADRTKVLKNMAAVKISVEDVDLVVSGDDVKRKKPFPDIFQYAALSLGVTCDEALVVEDALTGVKAAVAAGCLPGAVATSFDAASLIESGACLVLPHVGDFDDFSTVQEFNALVGRYIRETAGRTVAYGAVRLMKEDRVVPAPDAAALDRLRHAASAVRLHAYAPYSTYKVGAALLSARTGAVYAGCNVENSSYGATICAERNAILHAIAEEGKIGIAALVVVSDDAPPAPPCAQCLQVLAEFCRPDTVVRLCSASGDVREHLFSDLLPYPFIFPTQRSEGI